ncbi:hypothetical protein [Chroococcidiopsis sp. CCMEE 29]|uniref:hypothetical protein n=1 Tax=Chroococcidiopsis sp. CCMEE 29 TaxID=155894 RepID=UPI002021C2DF|nr:hypothetical protein [Chroococcidiopsis sp. CCMEE 29]
MPLRVVHNLLPIVARMETSRNKPGIALKVLFNLIGDRINKGVVKTSWLRR